MTNRTNLISTLSLLATHNSLDHLKIRIGGSNDRGYILADVLKPEQDVVSIGANWNLAFEADLAKRNHNVYVLNYIGPKEIVSNSKIHFPTDGYRSTGEFNTKLSESVPALCDWISKREIAVLRISLGGAEWDLLDSLDSKAIQNCEQLIIEFHEFSNLNRIEIWQRANRVFLKLNIWFRLIHVHANNCGPSIHIFDVPFVNVLQCTYLRKDIGAFEKRKEPFPTSLDAPCDPTRPELPLWFFPFPTGSMDAPAIFSINGEARRLEDQEELHRYRLARELRSSSTNSHVSFPRFLNSSHLEKSPKLRILLVSVHPVLEYDDIVMFERLGHVVFSLGFYLTRTPSERIRPSLTTTDWHTSVLNLMTRLGLLEARHKSGKWIINDELLREFDFVIVHHDMGFLDVNYEVLKKIPVIWRGIGQEDGQTEPVLRHYRQHGIKVVRWSPVQREFRKYAGADAIIRAAKDPEEWSNWIGDDASIVTFANDFVKRGTGLSYPFWKSCVSDFPVRLYGLRNDGLEEWQGTADYDDQRRLLRKARVAFVTGTRPAPYSLGFIEAWITGTPVVHIGLKPGEPQSEPYELPSLIEHGKNGFIVSSVEEAREVFSLLLNDRKLAQAISTCGRKSAMQIFGMEAISTVWRDFFRDELF